MIKVFKPIFHVVGLDGAHRHCVFHHLFSSPRHASRRRCERLPCGQGLGRSRPSELRWELRVPYGNLQKCYTKCSHTRGWTINPFILQTFVFSFVKVSSEYFSGCPSSFVDRRRTGLCEWMAWMWFAYDHTPSIYDALMPWPLCTYFERPSTSIKGFTSMCWVVSCTNTHSCTFIFFKPHSLQELFFVLGYKFRIETKKNYDSN